METILDMLNKEELEKLDIYACPSGLYEIHVIPGFTLTMSESNTVKYIEKAIDICYRLGIR